MLDLGAQRCRPARPGCDGCPARRWCAWKGEGPDPSVGSAGVSGGQSRFEGSDRQGRGRLVAVLRERGGLQGADLAAVAGWPDDPARVERVVAGLVADGLVRRRADGGLAL
jgi:A/G-specific adenine glycosylase